MRARKKHVSGVEAQGLSGTVEQRRVEFTVRYRSNITPSCRVVEGSSIFDIIDVRNVEEKNREMVLTCEYRDRISN